MLILFTDASVRAFMRGSSQLKLGAAAPDLTLPLTRTLTRTLTLALTLTLTLALILTQSEPELEP